MGAEWADDALSKLKELRPGLPNDVAVELRELFQAIHWRYVLNFDECGEPLRAALEALFEVDGKVAWRIRVLEWCDAVAEERGALRDPSYATAAFGLAVKERLFDRLPTESKVQQIVSWLTDAKIGPPRLAARLSLLLAEKRCDTRSEKSEREAFKSARTKARGT